MTDIYTNTSAFGLMSEEMQAQMKAHPGPWDVYSYRSWGNCDNPSWYDGDIYRAVRPPEPPKVYEAWGIAREPHEGWLSIHSTEEGARLDLRLGAFIVHLTGSKKDE